MRTSVMIVLLAAAIFGAPAFGQTQADPKAAVRAALQAELEDFSQPGWNREPASWTADGVFAPEAGPELTKYRHKLIANADWTGGPVWHQAGTLPWTSRKGEPGRLGVNVFFPSGMSRGTMLFVHGYLAHAADFAYSFAYFTAKGYTVVTLDLPGHGMSTGARGDIGSFAEYGDAVALWLNWVWKQPWPGEKLLMAHSLGTAACFEALERPGTPRPDRIVFCAPLLRPVWYPALSLGEVLVGWAFRDLPSRFGWDGFLDGYAMPVHWFEALERWLDGLDRRAPQKLPLTIYQGKEDTVVEGGWNTEEYRRLVPGVNVIMLPGEGHLFLSGKTSRAAFHERLAADLGL